ESLCAQCAHSNSGFYKQLHRMKLWARKRGIDTSADSKSPSWSKLVAKLSKTEPPVINTWSVDDKTLSLPRGATTHVRDVFKRHNLPEPLFIDEREEGDPALAHHY